MIITAVAVGTRGDVNPLAELADFMRAGEKPIFVAFGKAESPELAKLQEVTLEALKRTGIRAIVQAFQLPEKERVNTDGSFLTY